MNPRILIIMAAFFTGSLYAQPQGDVVKAYLELKQALYRADVSGAAETGRQLLKQVTGTPFFGKTESELNIIIKTTSIGKQREAFGKMSKAIWPLLSVEQKEELYLVYCPMEGAYWIDNNPSFLNPFFGAKMASCGKIAEGL